MNEINVFKINFLISAEDDEASNKVLSFISSSMDELDEVCGSIKFRDVFRVIFAFAQLDVVLAESKSVVLAQNDSQKSIMELSPEYMEACKGVVPPVTLYEETGIPYYNTGEKTLSDSINGELENRLKAYVAGYSPSIQVIMSYISFSENLGRLSTIKMLDQVVKEALAAGAGLSNRARLQVASELLLETGAEDPIVTCMKDMRGYTVVEQVVSS